MKINDIALVVYAPPEREGVPKWQLVRDELRQNGKLVQVIDVSKLAKKRISITDYIKRHCRSAQAAVYFCAHDSGGQYINSVVVKTLQKTKQLGLIVNFSSYKVKYRGICELVQNDLTKARDAMRRFSNGSKSPLQPVYLSH